MPYKEVKVEKLYYTIGEVARMFKVNTSLIRFWEKEFDIIKPKKNKKGNRLFTQKDIDNFYIIYHLVKEKGMTLVPVTLFINDRGLAKLEIALARGKHFYDKRENLKEKDTKREMDRHMKGRR